MKPQPDEDGLARLAGQWVWHDTDEREYRCPFGRPGERLWVKETWRIWESQAFNTSGEPLDPNILTNSLRGYSEEYLKTRPIEYHADTPGRSDGPWRPSIHMPRWASRITLEITDIRLERVQDISEEDVLAEGVLQMGFVDRGGYYSGFADLWDSIYASSGIGWDTNPWVWVIHFKVVESCLPQNVCR